MEVLVIKVFKALKVRAAAKVFRQWRILLRFSGESDDRDVHEVYIYAVQEKS